MVATLPSPRGPLSRRLVDLLRRPVDDDARPLRAGDADLEDRSLALWVLHELHYRGFAGVEEAWEWSPALAWLRRDLEADLEARVRQRYAEAERCGDPALVAAAAHPDDVGEAVMALTAAHEGPSVARYVQRNATYAEVVELLRQRSIYHLKEADPTAWTVARLEAGPKAALMQVQYDEYGVGDPERLHHALFARGLADSGIDATYGAHVDTACREVLEQNNVLSMLGLQRRLRAASLGHFAAFEATSSVPSRQLAQGLERLGFPASMVAYYDEHVEADAVHEQVAARDVCGALVADEPALRDDVLLGAWTCLDLESRTGARLLDSWAEAAA